MRQEKAGKGREELRGRESEGRRKEGEGDDVSMYILEGSDEKVKQGGREKLRSRLREGGTGRLRHRMTKKNAYHHSSTMLIQHLLT